MIRASFYVGCSHWGSIRVPLTNILFYLCSRAARFGRIIIIIIILVNIEIMIIQTIIFYFENIMYLFSMSLPQKHFVTENFEISPKNNAQNGQKENVKIYNNVQICIQLLCTFYKFFNKKININNNKIILVFATKIQLIAQPYVVVFLPFVPNDIFCIILAAENGNFEGLSIGLFCVYANPMIF